VYWLNLSRREIIQMKKEKKKRGDFKKKGIDY